jgi:Sodium/calcium exchanger protein
MWRRGNAAEHATAVTVAIKDKMDLAIGVAVGSGMQISLLVIPLSVILGWIIHADMTLIFDNFQIAVLFVSIILVNYLIADGKSRESNPNRKPHMSNWIPQTGWRASFSWLCTSLLRLLHGSSLGRVRSAHAPQSKVAARSRLNGIFKTATRTRLQLHGAPAVVAAFWNCGN